ncbi:MULTISPECIES: fimbrial protein [Providencia]|uniref:fimbrial protein n=1 Tax=Providencia TaxID=586 RepID=UPI0012B63169|nr:MULTISPECIES: fimbrial protein [Providencia]MTC57396.1 fimbrial protein [Providencia rustigianii]
MPLINQWRLLIGMGALFAASHASAHMTGYSHCDRTREPTYKLDMDMGRIVVDPNLAVGGVIARKSWPLRSSSNDVYLTCYGRNDLDAEIVMPGLRDIGSRIYQSSVPGIGMRFERAGQVSMTYPDTYTVNGGRWGTNYYLAGSTFTLTLIKTAAVTGSGSIAKGEYTRYGDRNSYSPILTTSLTANAITIVSPSCMIESGKNQNVYLETIKRSQLTGRDTVAGTKNFDIVLRCSGGTTASGYANIKMDFSGNHSVSAVEGVLKNEATGSNAAKGVGIQVIERKSYAPINFGKIYDVGRLTNTQERTYVLEYAARYFQYDSYVSTGEVRSHMVFDITYD